MVQPRHEIDAHQHFWRYDPVEYALDRRLDAGAAARFHCPRTLQREMRAAGVRAQHRRAGAADAGGDALAARRSPTRIRSLPASSAGSICSRRRSTRSSKLSRPHRKLVGVRHIVQAEPDGFLIVRTFRRGFARLERFGLTYDILIYARQLPEAVDLRSRVARASASCSITSGSRTSRAAASALAAALRGAGRLSARLVQAVRSGHRSRLAIVDAGAACGRTFETALDCFGPERLMIGSDWPVCTVAGPYARTLAVVEDALAGCSSDERASVLGGTAQHLWNRVRVFMDLTPASATAAPMSRMWSRRPNVRSCLAQSALMSLGVI